MDPMTLDRTNEERIDAASRDERLSLLLEYAAQLDEEDLRALAHLTEGLASRRHVFGQLDVDNDDRNARQHTPAGLRNAISLLGRRLVRSGQ